MARTLTAASLAALQGQQAEIFHLLSLDFSAGTVRFTSGPTAVDWNGVSWSAAGGAMSFEAVQETPDASGQRLKITLDGVSLGAITAVLSESYIGHLATLYRGYLNAQGTIIVDPFVLFTGYLNAPWDISEDWDNGWAKVETEIVSPLAIFHQIRGIRADLSSHQAFYATDGFFKHIVQKPAGDFGWGISTRAWR